MKKISFFFLSLFMLTLINCKKDDNNDDENTNQKKPVPVTITTTSSATRPVSDLKPLLSFKNLIQASRSSQSTSTQNFTYDGRSITKVTTTSGSDITVENYYYKDMNKGLLDSIVRTLNGQFDGKVIYETANDHITAMRYYDNTNTMFGQMTFSNYDSNGHPSNVGYLYVNPNGNIDMTGTVTYANDNVQSLDLSGQYMGYNLTMTEQYTYDNKNIVYLNVETQLSPLFAKNNVTRLESSLEMAGSSISQSILTYTYTYNNDDYPETSDITSIIIQNGNTTTESSSQEFTYEDK